MLPAAVAPPNSPGFDHAEVKAAACQDAHQADPPRSRLSIRRFAVLAQQRIGKFISESTVGRILRADAIRPWQVASWKTPRAANFAVRGRRVLDLDDRHFGGVPLDEDCLVISVLVSSVWSIR